MHISYIGYDIEKFIKSYKDIYKEDEPEYDFCLRTKVPRSSRLISRTFKESDISEMLKDTNDYSNSEGYNKKGQDMLKNIDILSEKEENRVTRYTISNSFSDPKLVKLMPPTPKQIDEGKYEDREIGISKPYHVNICSHMKDFKWETLNYDYYIHQTRSLCDFKEIDIESL